MPWKQQLWLQYALTTDSSRFISSSSSSISSSADRNNRVNLSTILFVQKVINHFIDLGHMECSEHVQKGPKKYTLNVSLHICILYVQGVCMVLMLVIPAYSFPRQVYLLFCTHMMCLRWASPLPGSGSVPVSINLWKITVKLGAIWLAHSLRIRLGIPSGPDAFDEFMSSLGAVFLHHFLWFYVWLMTLQ